MVSSTPCRNRSAQPCSSRTSARERACSSPIVASTSQATEKMAETKTSSIAKLIASGSRASS
ncbi:Uncharacterised protein [Mycobacteroides abscessus subsp. abscessus]|nr:Uncharacterised protein [Mycobacteroides abscessus subsp. abscessus]